MNLFRLILASLWHHWRMHGAVALGAAAGTAVLTGALLVGDSMHGSLRHLTLDRLGRIDEILVANRFFRAQLADELAASPALQQPSAAAVPAILLKASLEKPDPRPATRANGVNLVGCDARFWQLGGGGVVPLPKAREVVLNAPAAEQLGVKVGDVILLHLPRPGTIPGDSPLGRKEETVQTQRCTVTAIIAAEGLGRFGLRPTQQLPRNAYVALDWLAERLGQADRVNVVLLAGASLAAESAPTAATTSTPRAFQPSLADYGLAIEQTPRGYINITCDRMLFEPAVEREIVRALGHLLPSDAGDEPIQPALTYLANTIACDGREVPYSTVTALDFRDQPPLGPLLGSDGKPMSPLTEGQIVLNSWTARELQAKPGNTIRVSYFEPESTHGQVREQTAEFQLAAIAELGGAADDRALTPVVPGVTDQLSMGNWDPPFPFQAGRIRKQDEQYWTDHGATPKAFVSLAAGRRLWGSRFGQTTSIRVRPAAGMTADRLRRDLALDPAAMGFVFQPVRAQGLAASAGTTPFNLLFLGFSSFIIAAAVMLVALLFRLGIDRRATELGILTAVGFPRRRIALLLGGEGLLVAAIGSLLGVPAGIGYAALMLLGLRTWWLAAVTTPFLQLYVTCTSLLVGFGSGVAVAMLAVLWALWRMRRVAPRQLLAGEATGVDYAYVGRRRIEKVAADVVLIGVIALGVWATKAPEDLQPGLFFGIGALVLAAALAAVWARLHSGAIGFALRAGHGNLLRMALRNAARNPGRSMLCVGLVAAATFLIVVVSAFRLDPDKEAKSPDGGTAGFNLVAESDQPIYQDLGTRKGRAQLGFSPEDEQLLAGCEILSLRVNAGDDASCLNLYRPRQPRILGTARAPETRRTVHGKDGSVWDGLGFHAKDPEHAADVPVVLEKNTANYSLHLWKGVGETFDVTDSRGRTVTLQVAGLLSNSIFQGDLLISEADFLRHFPEVNGYRFFLIQTPPDKTAAVGATLERSLGDYGLTTELATQRLAGFMAVQNTYLSTFQVLGGLGLLLGTFGLAAVELRNVLERRGELALLRAAGFRRLRLAAMVLCENGLLLLAGLGAGLLAAFVAILPHLLSRVASIPWSSLGATLALVLAVGLSAGLLAVRAVLHAPLLPALRQGR